MVLPVTVCVRISDRCNMYFITDRKNLPRDFHVFLVTDQSIHINVTNNFHNHLIQYVTALSVFNDYHFQTFGYIFVLSVTFELEWSLETKVAQLWY